MMSETNPVAGLDVLQAGEGPDLVVVDFVQFSTGRSIGDALVAALPGRTVLRVDTVADLGETGYVELSALARSYAKALAAQAVTPLVLVGYCSAAPLAIAIGAELQDAGVAVAELLLVTPSFPDRTQVTAELREILTDFELSADTTPELPAEATDAAARVRQLVVDCLTQAAVAQDMSAFEAEILVEELGKRYIAWLAYLIAAADAKVPPIFLPTRLVGCDEPVAEPPGGWPAGARSTCIDVPQGEITGHPDFLALLGEL
jgi:thioesterase domain-containing protein